MIFGKHERQTGAVAIRSRGKCGHLGDEAHALHSPVLGVVYVLGLRVEGGQTRNARHEQPHRVGAVVKRVEDALAEVLVHEGVQSDFGNPRVKLCRGGQLPEVQQVGNLGDGALLG